MIADTDLVDEEATRQIGARLAAAMKPPLLVGLSGDLGAGKTTLVRALINAILPGTRVKSPTYTLVESYTTPRALLHHLDLYRIQDPTELQNLGLTDLLSDDAIVLIEWPEKGARELPELDVMIRLRHLAQGRRVQVEGLSERGRAALAIA